MKKYDEYKDSGVAWIGEVPKHWEVIKLKYKYHFQTGATPNTGKKENFEGELKWANISDLNGSVVYDTTKHINKEAASKCSMNISPKGSLMYSFKLSVGTVAFCGEDMYTNEAIASFIPQKNDLKYLFYCAPIFIIHNANRNIYNAPLLNQELIKNALICLPSLNEQTAIAAYLDTHCAKIDNLISIHQKRIALLQELKQSVITHAVTKGLNPNVEMKQSGVEWIGDVPNHWEVIKLKYKYHFQTGATPNTGKKENFEGDLRWANISDLNGSVVYDTTKHINKEAASECSMNISPKGSLMYSFKLSVGTVAFCGEDMYTNEAIASFIPQKNDLKYLFYCAPIFIIHNANRNIYNAPLLNQELIKNALICLPSLNEQTAIATYLDHKCATIDASISNAQHQIELLQEYKQSLITEVVTGKRKVTDN